MARGHRKAGAAPEVLLPITPMLDMSFQLLFFFICIYQPPSVMEVELPLILGQPDKTSSPPAEEQSQRIPPIEPKDVPPPPIPKQANNLVIVVNTHLEANNQTTIESFTVKNLQDEVLDAQGLPKAKEKPEIVVPNLDKLRELLKNAHLKDASIPEQLAIVAPAKEKWGTAVQILDICREAGWKNVVFAEPK